MNAPSSPVAADALEQRALFALIERVAKVSDRAEIDFMAVNDAHLLSPYRQASLWLERGGTLALSGVASMERNAPYVQWLNRLCAQLHATGEAAVAVSARDLPPAVSAEWAEWLPPYGLWVPIRVASRRGTVKAGGVLFSREEPWSEHEMALLSAWLAAWAGARQSLAPMTGRTAVRLPGRRALAWGLSLAAVLAALLYVPVPVSVLAPAELVPVEPMPVRAPLDGVVREFYVRPNQAVKAGDPLFAFDLLQLSSRLEVATQALATADAELRQLSQQALNDPKARAQLAVARGNVAEKRAEVEYLRGQRGRSRVLAAQDGTVLLDDPQEWIGRPVSTGERILRLASDAQKEIEAWVPVGDAIPLTQGSPVRFYLSASPLEPVTGRIRYVAYDAVRRPDGNYAYRARASLDEATAHRIGLKGTARLTGETASLGYWMFRRPVATVREFFGI